MRLLLLLVIVAGLVSQQNNKILYQEPKKLKLSVFMGL